MDPVTAVRDIAKARRARVREQCLTIDDFDDPMVVEAKFTHDGRPLIVRASRSRFQVEARIDTALVFSVGAPNRWWSHEPLGVLSDTQIPQTPVFGNSSMAAVDARETALAWIAEPTHRALFERLRLGTSESVHVVQNNVWALLRGDRVLDEALFEVFVSLAVALETVPPPPQPPQTEEPFDGPPELAAFLREFGHLAEGDDGRRDEMAEQLTRSMKAKFLRRVNPLFSAINEYLDSLKGAWPDQAIKLGQLGELGAELSVATAAARTTRNHQGKGRTKASGSPESTKSTAVPVRPSGQSRMTAEVFAMEMADRLTEIVPAGVEVSADGDFVWFGVSGKRESGTSTFLVDADQSEYDANLLVMAADGILNLAQDYVVMFIRERWPPFTRADGGIGMAGYYVRLDGNVLRMGYGEEDDPVLALRPLIIEE